MKIEIFDEEFGMTRPHKNKPKCKKSQDWTFTRNQMASQKQTKTQKSSRLNLHAGPTGNTKRRVWNSKFNALFSKMNLHSKSLFVTPPICLYNCLQISKAAEALKDCLKMRKTNHKLAVIQFAGLSNTGGCTAPETLAVDSDTPIVRHSDCPILSYNDRICALRNSE